MVGPRVLTPSEIKDIEENASRDTHKKVSLHAWCRVELVVTGKKMVSVEGFTKELVGKKGLDIKQ